MKKRIKKIMICIMAAVLVFTAMPMNSLAAEPTIIESGKCGENVTYTLDSDGLLTISGEGEMENYEWVDSPFYENSSIKSVVINNDVTSVGNYVFYYCTGLKSVTIPDSVTNIGNYSFCCCTSLTCITIPNSVTRIEHWAFRDCTGLQEINFGSELEYIGYGAFENCTGLSEIKLPEKVKTICASAFSSCTNLLKVDIPSSVVSIGEIRYPYGDSAGIDDATFTGCAKLLSINVDKNNPSYSSLEGVLFNKDMTCLIEYPGGKSGKYIVPDAVKSIQEFAFKGHSEITEIVLPSSLEEICWCTFYGCDNLKQITIPNSVTSIGDYAFDNCTGLTSITIPNGVTRIGWHAFYNCTGLTSVTIPNSVTSIGDFAFSDCTGLASIKVDKNNKVYDSRNNCNAIIETASNTLIYGCKNTVIPNSITSIGDYAFRGCTGLTSVTIPNSVTSIGDFAFSDCTGLTSVTIGNSVASIGDDAFDNTDYYNNSANWDNGVLYISNYLIKAKDTIEGEYKIKDGIKVIADGAFEDCTGLASIKVDKNNKVYDSRNNCNAIIETASNTLIYGCKNTVIPNSITSIGDYAFCDCTGLTSVTIPNSVTSIDEYAFYGCTGLTNITIPDSVTSIGEYVFYECSNLKDVYYMGTEEQWKQINIGDDNECLTNATIHYNWSPCEESNITVNGKDYSVIMDYGTAFDEDVDLNISKSDSGNFEIPLNPFLSLNINAVSDGKEVQPDKPITLMFEKSMFNCGVDELTIFHFPDGKTPETFNNRKTDSAYHITEKTLDGKTYYCITVSSLSPFIFTDGTGDVNSDGTVNSSDALTVLQHSVGQITLTNNDFIRADVDRNKTVNSADALKILQFSVGQINTF